MAQKGNYVSKKKGAKKGTRKKVVDTFAKKEWYDLKAPSFFTNRIVGKTLVSRASQKQNLDKLLLGRNFIVNQADLVNDEEVNFRNFKFIVTDVHGKEGLSDFNGMDLTTDKARGIIKKWHTLIEANIAVKTSDGYILRVFVMGQSRRPEGFTKARCYIQTTKIKMIRRVMFDVITSEMEDGIEEVIRKLCGEKIGKEIERRCFEIFPLQNCYVKKVMVIKRPRFVREESEENKWEENQWAEENQWEEENQWVPPVEEERGDEANSEEKTWG